jgi:hypothetical protein
MKIKQRVLYSAVAFALAGTASSLGHAAVITGWNTDNVVTTPPPAVGDDGFSVIYDSTTTSGANTSGYIKFTPPEGESPGLDVENDTPASASASSSDVDNCILAAGSPDPTCNGERQTGKRFKLDRTAFDPIDLVFDVDADGTFNTIDNDGLYKVFGKYGNATGSAIESFTVGLGFGIGDLFTASTDGDGLGFVDFGTDPKNNQFSTLFAAGLFGPVDPPEHPLEGYFSDSRTGFNLDLKSEDLFESAGLFGDYGNLFGDWLSYDQVPDGYFYDNDGDPLTDAILMANQEDDGTWSVNRGIDSLGNVFTLDDAARLTGLTLDQVIDALNANFTAPSCDIATAGTACLAGVGAIEDLAKFNLTFFLDQIGLPGSDGGPLLAGFDQFTLRITAVESVPAPGVLSLLGLGLLGLSGVRRRRSATALR